MNRFEKFRRFANLTQIKAAEKIGNTQGAISAWERGESLPRSGILTRVAQIYGCTIDDLLDEEETRNKKAREGKFEVTK